MALNLNLLKISILDQYYYESFQLIDDIPRTLWSSDWSFHLILNTRCKALQVLEPIQPPVYYKPVSEI